jgi:hypothetical protein
MTLRNVAYVAEFPTSVVSFFSALISGYDWDIVSGELYSEDLETTWLTPKLFGFPMLEQNPVSWGSRNHTDNYYERLGDGFESVLEI